MGPKKADGAPKPKSTHASYQDMITDAIVHVITPIPSLPAHYASPDWRHHLADASFSIVQLKERNGSSRQQLKKYVKANNTINVSDKMFDSLFNKALKAGVDKGIFEQPKGPSGGTKLSKKSKPAATKPAAKKEGDKEAPKKAAPKKETAKKPAAPKKAAAPKKEATEKKPAAKKAAAAPPKKAPATKKAAPKKDAPAAEEKPAALTKTKSGRVAKTASKPATKKAAPKKAAAPKKEKTPKKEAKAEAAS
ncbi:linker histone H1 and H5 family-domain-containing protein [Annulohypoxylon truncatum]|uniref:linker histone H1 and H5 family-domain-containing protein n=1 Tax=Annulohypoxylon truncatum TaxID=327061 RepID=UPI0020080E13|nr:linker histone H1 and H5 family-domain-containing protein [Annulohypoxylon truncatum]KAI1210168.1 linker histone H1 and H5 family-domain-containing protein [Annulohypoxylon truncatum]